MTRDQPLEWPQIGVRGQAIKLHFYEDCHHYQAALEYGRGMRDAHPVEIRQRAPCSHCAANPDAHHGSDALTPFMRLKKGDPEDFGLSPSPETEAAQTGAQAAQEQDSADEPGYELKVEGQG